MFKKIFITLIICLCVSSLLVVNISGNQSAQEGFINSNIVERVDAQGNIISPILQSSRYQLSDEIDIDFVIESK